MQKVKLAMYLPGKQKKQTILNMIYTAKRMKFTPYCIAKTLAKIYHVSERTIYRYCAKENP
jgi:transcriptional antiterminator